MNIAAICLKTENSTEVFNLIKYYMMEDSHRPYRTFITDNQNLLRLFFLNSVASAFVY